MMAVESADNRHAPTVADDSYVSLAVAPWDPFSQSVHGASNEQGGCTW